MQPPNSVEINPDNTQPLPAPVLETVRKPKTEQIADILRGGETPAAPPDESQAPPPPAETLDIQTLAERLAVEPAKLYETLKIGLDGEETVTLGQLKDGFKTAAAVESERKAHREERAKYEAGKMQTQRELEALLSALPQHAITAELIDQAQRQLKEHTSRETEDLLRRVPDWIDGTIAAADTAVIKDFIKGYGFEPWEFDHPSVPARLKHLLRDVALRDKALKAVKAKPPPVKGAQAPKSLGPRTAAQDFGRIKAAVTSKQMTRTEAIGRILKGA